MNVSAGNMYTYKHYASPSDKTGAKNETVHLAMNPWQEASKQTGITAPRFPTIDRLSKSVKVHPELSKIHHQPQLTSTQHILPVQELRLSLQYF